MAKRMGLRALVSVGIALLSAGALAQPRTGGGMVGPTTLVVGDAVVRGGSPTAPVIIYQTTTRGVIEWTRFSQASSIHVFSEPSSTSVTLNQLGGLNVSIIAGTGTVLTTNGTLANTGSVTLGTGTLSIPGGTLTLATSGNTVSNTGGIITLRQAGAARPVASSRAANATPTTVRDSGLVGLVGPSAAQHGAITAKLGHVKVGGTRSVTVDLAGDGLIGLQIATSSGAITPAGSVAMTAATARVVIDSITNVPGMTQATGARLDGGAVVFGSAR